MYYELIRELLGSCWERLTEIARVESLTIGDFLTTEIPRLEKVREAWLDTPDPSFHRRTPRSIIDRERASASRRHVRPGRDGGPRLSLLPNAE